MKIAFVFDGLGFGGIEKVGIDYIALCLQLGHQVDVYNLSPKDNVLVERISKNIGYYPKKFSRKICPELYSYGVQKAWWGKYAYALISPFISFAQAIKKLFCKKRRYDTAIAFSGHINDLSFVAKSFVKANQKICWCHGNILSYFAICDAYSMLYKKIDKFVVLSEAGQKDIYAGHHFMYGKKIYKIYNPTFIQEQQVDWQAVKSLQDKYGDFILYIGRFDKRKGQDVAIQIIRRMKESGCEKHIVFLGDGDTFEAMQLYAKEQCVDDLCHFEGVKKNVCDYITACYINLLTSKWEGLPTVIVEAMALGKPCVMTNTDDGEVSDHGKYCKLVSVGDVDGGVVALAEFYNDSEAYKRYSQLSIQRSKDFSPEQIRGRLSELLEN